MSGDLLNDRHSIKNLLFSKPIPNYVPASYNGIHKVYSCIDCGDKYTLESSLHFHINRKSVKISYFCRHCGDLKVFYNRCNFLAHIRSHAFKTATINVADLKVEPLPLSFFDMTILLKEQTQTSRRENLSCIECKKELTGGVGTFEDRMRHYMQVTTNVYSCPVCLFTLPTECALKTHLRVHLKIPPYFCPECGMRLSNKSLSYPYHNHNCEGFKMMRATARVKCHMPNCFLFHPNEIKDHIKNNHLVKVFKCMFCYVGCFDVPLILKHVKNNHSREANGPYTGNPYVLFYQCEMCKGKLVNQNQIENHLTSHVTFVHYYPCWACGCIFPEVSGLIDHHIQQHGSNEALRRASSSLILKNKTPAQNPNQKRLYRVVKRCEKCHRSFKYKCKYDQILSLPYICPYNCTISSGKFLQQTSIESDAEITCYLCKKKISENWETVKEHYAENHKTHQCLDAEIKIQRLDDEIIKKFLKNKQKVMRATKKKVSTRNSKNLTVSPSNSRDVTNSTPPSPNNTEEGQHCCSKCGKAFANKEQLETHLVVHRDPCMAYQCMECGQCFVVKPTFSKHLILEHAISDVEGYIAGKQCFNENALQKYQYAIVDSEPLKENQCKICREQFENSSDLEKHFRVHGMAFLMKTINNTP